MRKLDMFWMTNKAWYELKHDGDKWEYFIKDDAPEEAKKSFAHYLEQKKDENPNK